MCFDTIFKFPKTYGVVYVTDDVAEFLRVSKNPFTCSYTVYTEIYDTFGQEFISYRYTTKSKRDVIRKIKEIRGKA